MKTLDLVLSVTQEPVTMRSAGKAQGANAKAPAKKAARKATQKRALELARFEASSSVAQTFARVHSSKEFTLQAALEAFGSLGRSSR